MANVNIFISHSWSYSGDYDKIYEWLCESEWNSAGERIYFVDCSVPKDDPIHFAPNDATLQAAIYARIEISNVVIIPTGVYASYSKWIGKEVEGSQLYRKPIVAVDGWGAQRTSSVVQSAAAEIVGWQKKSVGQATWRQFNR